MRLLATLAAIAALLVHLPAALAQDRPLATLYKNPQCGCCEGYADYLRGNGFEVDVRPTMELAEISRRAGVPAEIQGCHTMFIDDYVIEGHVPIGTIDRLLPERPQIAGITLPGMPLGSPGMGGARNGTWTIYAIPADGGAPSVYATE